MRSSPKVLVVDLNNFARYPSIAIGYLVAVLREGGFEVELLAPLSTGITGVPREPRPPWWGALDREFRYRTGTSRSRAVQQMRTWYTSRRVSKLARSGDAVAREFSRRLDSGVDAVLVSTYLMYHPHCVELARLCGERDIPFVLGGPYFAVADVAREWVGMPGLTALVGGEVEPHLCELVRRVIARESVEDLPGVWRTEPLSLHAPPLADLDAVPYPDYSDFPWDRYPNTIVPIITGRGCGWGVCSFCADITSTAGRSFRSRSVANVLGELEHQHARHGARLFVFTDLKLNSSVDMWRGVVGGIQAAVPGARWIGAVHVGTRGPNGLDADALRAARAAGMVRLTTGLESGSQRVLDRMAKGTDLTVTSRFLKDARAAGISVRTTMFTGYPGETAEDLQRTADFLEAHAECLERVPLYRFTLNHGTLFEQQLRRRPEQFPTLTHLRPDPRVAVIPHHYTETEDPAYRRGIRRLLRVVHRINRKPLLPSARDFEGVM